MYSSIVSNILKTGNSVDIKTDLIFILLKHKEKVHLYLLA